MQLRNYRSVSWARCQPCRIHLSKVSRYRSIRFETKNFSNLRYKFAKSIESSLLQKKKKKKKEKSERNSKNETVEEWSKTKSKDSRLAALSMFDRATS